MIRSVMTDIPIDTYERIFGHSGPVINNSGHVIQGSKSQDVRLVDDDGKIINRVTSHHKNKIYKQVKVLKENLKHELCTKSECWDPTEKNVQKMINNEMQNPRIQSYKLAMKAIGADPHDCNVESLRRGR